MDGRDAFHVYEYATVLDYMYLVQFILRNITWEDFHILKRRRVLVAP